MGGLVKKAVTSSPFDIALLGCLQAEEGVPWSIEWQASVDSTQDLARIAAESGAAEGWTVVTDWQRQGRGRLGRQWVTPPGRDLLFSTVLHPGAPLLSLLPLLAGVAVATGIEQASGLTLDLKWPNDLLYAGNKLAGILLETGGSGAAILGVGVNVNSEADTLPTGATSLRVALGRSIAREPLLTAILGTIGKALERCRAEGDAWVVPAWRAKSSMLGNPVSYEDIGVIRFGVAEDIEPDGSLRVRLSAGRVTRVRAGEVRRVRS